MRDISEDVILKAARGDLESFEEIFKTCVDYVFNAAVHIVRNTEDAEEITQIVFMELYRKLDTFRFQSSLTTWIYRITINTAINYIKNNLRVKTVGYDDTLFSVPSRDLIEENIDKEYNECFIKRLLDNLTVEQKSCVMLRSVEGLSYEKIAKALNITIGSVRSRLKRARRKLLALRKEVAADVL